MAVRAHKLMPPSLPWSIESALCKDYLKGFCRNGDACSRSHAIYRIVNQDQSSQAPTPLVSQNALDLGPRVSAKDDSVFDHDGPGHLSFRGSRHDNDHADIREVRILPTADEILSQRPSYMPYKDFHLPHFLEAGQSRLLDTLFRQLRYDSTESIIDACYHACQKLVLSRTAQLPTLDNYEVRQDTPKGTRYHLFWEVSFEELIFDDVKGIIIRISFACPPFLRGRRMHTSGFFEDGMLLGLLGLDNTDSSLSVTFFETHLRESTDAMQSRGGKGMRAAIQLSFAQREDLEDVRRMLYYFKGILTGRFVLIEFPKVLLPGFSWCLKRLQELYLTHNIPFGQQIAPTSPFRSSVQLQPPVYATKSDFVYDLTLLQTPRDRTVESADFHLPAFEAGQDNEIRSMWLRELKEKTTLDEGQAIALCENLNRGLAFTQGPPGTGKTYLGAALAKAILASQSKATPKPILTVCMTNHALDSFLEDLLKDGIMKVARLGGGSKEDWIKPHTLRELSSKLKLTQIEQSNLSKSRLCVEYLTAQGIGRCEALCTSDLSWHSIQDYLRLNYPKIHSQFTTLGSSDYNLSELRLARKAGGFAFYYWSEGGDINNLRELPSEFAVHLGVDISKYFGRFGASTVENLLGKVASHTELQAKLAAADNVWSLLLSARRDLIDRWKAELNIQVLVDQLVEIHRRHQRAVKSKRAASADVDARCLEQQQIIGVTTTACAKHWPLLQRLNLQTVICEEAGEVMEAHSLCTLLPSVEHAIFIGDPLQLRPQVAEQALSLETDVGLKYRLDQSLFERLMFPSQPGIHPVPTSHLSLQRRMHPDIANISRATLYPYLKDHESTYQHPSVSGMADRMYWFDHRVPEDASDARSPMSKSCSNTFEVEMVAGLVQYLIKGNAYDLGDISVLTPYNGQLASLTRRLSSTCSVWLSEKDRESLINDGFLSPEETRSGFKTEVDLLNMLRLATIDNFQGEESKIVILSTVRSNADGRVGFLKTQNRINVGCSRARDGFYILGNALLMSNVHMWKCIIDVFASQQRLGPCFRLCCDRHPDKYINIYQPPDFDNLQSCQIPCNYDLGCGHVCREKCHPLALHARMGCAEACHRSHHLCGHLCQKPCGQPCGECQLLLPPVTLRCGHEATVTCSELASGFEIVCKELIEQSELPCGHKFERICTTKDEVPICVHVCGAMLDCGHECLGICSVCSAASTHPECKSICSKPQHCGHHCLLQCHPGPCPPCTQSCERACQHGGCKRPCSSICDPCVKPCKWHCEHQGRCAVMCFLPCTRLPCSEPCTKQLVCGHICSSLCGERCVQNCAECERSNIEEHCQIVLGCGHTFDLEYLDRHVQIQDMYKIENGGRVASLALSRGFGSTLTCPTCLTPISDIHRYSVVPQVRALPDNIDRMIAKMGRKLEMFEDALRRKLREMEADFSAFGKKIRANPIAAKANQRLVWERGNSFGEVQVKVTDFRDDVVKPFQTNIVEVEHYLGQSEIFTSPIFSFDLRYDLLFLRCRLATLQEALKMSDFLRPLSDPSQQIQALAQGLRTLTAEESLQNIKAAEEAIVECETRKMKCLETELRLIQLSFHIVARSSGGISELNTEATCGRIVQLSRQYPDTAGKFFRGYKNLERSLHNFHPLGQLYVGDTADVWRRWGRHEVGHLTKCKYGHPYSTATFDGCPDCGREVEIMATPEPIDYESYMKNDEFLARMKGKR